MAEMFIFKGRLYKVPSLKTLIKWESKGWCKTPDGRIVESDHPESWMVLLGFI